MKRMWTVSDGALSNRRPVCLQVNVKSRLFRRGIHDCGQRGPRIKWDKLNESEINEGIREAEERMVRGNLKRS